ncbi:MAG TPA: GTPase HflX, partial [Actinomycetota bacterium]|nr:GTPase HflX [Actinomycetota bacterium]
SERERARVITRLGGDAVATSAVTGDGLEDLMDLVERSLPRFPMDVALLVPYGREDVTAMLHRDAEVLSEDVGDEGTLVRARVGERVLASVEPFRVEPGSVRATG